MSRFAFLRRLLVGVAEGATQPADLRALLDKELIKRFCLAGADQAAAEELWRRFQQTIYEALEKSSCPLCPAFYDPRDLVHGSYLQARQNLLARICEFKELES